MPADNDHGLVFVCSNATQPECLRRMLLGSPESAWATMSSIRNGGIVFLLNFQTRQMQGPYLADGAAEFNAVPEAWGGKFPSQARIRHAMPGVAAGSFVVGRSDRAAWRGAGHLNYRDTFECVERLLAADDFSLFVDLYMNVQRLQQRMPLAVHAPPPPGAGHATHGARTAVLRRFPNTPSPPAPPPRLSAIPPPPPPSPPRYSVGSPVRVPPTPSPLAPPVRVQATPPQPRAALSSREAGRVATEGISVISNDHSRQRKAERAVTKKDVQRAKKDGTWSAAGGGRWRCDYDGLVVIFAPDKRAVVTNYWASDRRQAAAEL